MVKTNTQGKGIFEKRRMKIDREIYESIQIDPEREEDVISLEEALLINDSSIRRALIMNISNQHSNESLTLLNQARLNDDVEVVHYAATAISELSREYDLRLQKLESEYHLHPEDKDVLNRYTLFLDEYINQNMVQGQFMLMQRIQFEELLKKEMEQHDRLDLYDKRIHNEFEINFYNEAAELLEQMKEKWPRLEQTWLLQIEYFARQMRGDKIQKTIEEIKKQNIYLTLSGRKMIEFWDKRVRKSDEGNQKQTI
ncbi:MAG: hypothetical protein RRZ63_09500 [Clostridium sp.]